LVVPLDIRGSKLTEKPVLSALAKYSENNIHRVRPRGVNTKQKKRLTSTTGKMNESHEIGGGCNVGAGPSGAHRQERVSLGARAEDSVRSHKKLRKKRGGGGYCYRRVNQIFNEFVTSKVTGGVWKEILR